MQTYEYPFFSLPADAGFVDVTQPRLLLDVDDAFRPNVVFAVRKLPSADVSLDQHVTVQKRLLADAHLLVDLAFETVTDLTLDGVPARAVTFRHLLGAATDGDAALPPQPLRCTQVHALVGGVALLVTFTAAAERHAELYPRLLALLGRLRLRRD
jgi:hypothetical protein